MINPSTSDTAVIQRELAESYKDGIYTGTGTGYRRGLDVVVTIKDNKITDVEIGSNNETPSFATRAFDVIPKEIIEAQSTDVDTVSGATRTSKGIIMAVEDALEQALGTAIIRDEP